MTPPPADSPDEHVSLTLGSRLVIRSAGTQDEVIETRGTFKGIVTVGTVDALAIALDESHGDLQGKTRIVPSHVILALDVIEPGEAESDGPDELGMHYS